MLAIKTIGQGRKPISDKPLLLKSQIMVFEKKKRNIRYTFFFSPADIVGVATFIFSFAHSAPKPNPNPVIK